MPFKNCQIVKTADCRDYFKANDAHHRGLPRWVVTSGMLREFGFCPLRWRDGYTPPDSTAKDYGARLDCWHLTPDEFWGRYTLQPTHYETTGMECPSCGSVTDSKTCANCKTNRVQITVKKEWTNQSATCAEWTAKQAEEGKEVVTQEQVDEVKAASTRILADPILAALHECSQKQVWVKGEWHDGDLIVPVQALIDYVPDKGNMQFRQALGDLKTTRSAHPSVWSRYSSQRKYHLQAAFYQDMFNSATGEERDTFVHVLSENFPPYQTGRSLMDLRKIDIGRALYQAYLAQYCKCLKTGEWPGYEREPGLIEGWFLDMPTKYDEQEAMNAMGAQTEVEPVAPPESGEDDIIP